MNDSSVETLDVAVVGAGFAGLYQLHRLRQLGFSVRLFEAGAKAGGVWYWNRYPGARVDLPVPQYEYSLEPVWRDWIWQERFPGRDELVAYFAHAVKRLNLASGIEFNSRVTAAHFNNEENIWHLTVNEDRHVRARFVVFCTGYASKPYVPEFPNIKRFGGDCYHSGLCPESLDFRDKRVAIIGTGASGVQLVQEGARLARRLTLFQRTPVYAIPMRQKRLDAATQREGQKQYAELFLNRAKSPGGALISVGGMSAHQLTDAERSEALERTWEEGGFAFWTTFIDVATDLAANRFVYDFWRDKVRRRIKDPKLQEILAPMEPPYPFGVKRPSLEQDYYEAFNRENVELVDMRKAGIDSFTETGITTTDGRKFDFDIIILATGFDAVTGGLTQIDLRGDQGQALADVWRNGVKTQLGLASKGFPNMWFIYGPQSPNNACVGPTCAEIQGEWVVSCLRHLRENQIRRFEATDKGQESWTQEMDLIASFVLMSKGDNWQTGANIPGKTRQLLTHVDYLRYMEFCRTSEQSGYADFALSQWRMNDSTWNPGK